VFAKILSVLLLAGLGSVLASPTAEEIIDKVKARSAAAEAEKSKFAYQRISRVDYLDDQGEVRKNSVRIYEVAPVDGRPVSRLVQINGRAPSPQAEAKRSAARETGDKTRNLALGEDLLGRYEYKLIGEENIADRKAWLLEFSPKRNAVDDGFIDKLLNAMHGTMWVDQEDYELSKIDVHLGRKVSFFGGLAGAIEKLDLHLVQKRVDATTWLTEGLSLDFTGRKLFTPIRFRCFETCSDFRKADALANN
jgi:hypothetical protein